MAAVRISELTDREFYAAMAMQGMISREGVPADLVAKQSVAYADALIEALRATAPKPRPSR
jgi:hypothetical protein